MPRILIADDNSNIQRMAALALKDVGIEVVAVGNGEAAVRKLAEISPDLVLADIFMPVRNGYEVCEYVKHDPKYSNIPVLLLAGAFDPFDEREAQRVQADGILKKPFVPPDPLINAVKTLLEKRAAERLMAATVPVEAASAPPATTPAATPEVAATAAEATEDPEAKAYEEPLSVVDFLSNSKKDSAKEKATSFASSLSFEVPVLDEPEPVVTASRDPVLGEPAFWVPEETQREPEEASGADESVEDLTDHTWGSSSRPAPVREDPDPPMMLELEPPRPAASVYDIDLTGVTPAVPEPVKESLKEAASESLAPELPPLESFSPPAPAVAASVPEVVNSASAKAIDEPPAELSATLASPAAAMPEPVLTDSALTESTITDSVVTDSALTDSAIADSEPAVSVPTVPEPIISAPIVPASASAKKSPEDTQRLAETEVAPRDPATSPWGVSATAEAHAKAPEVELAKTADAPPKFGAPSAPTMPLSAPTTEPTLSAENEDEDSAFLELEDSLASFAEFAAPAPITRAPEAKPAIQQTIAETDIGDDWPPAFVPVTVPSKNGSQKPALEGTSAWHTSAAPVPIDREASAATPAEPAEAPEAFEAPKPATVAALSPEAQEAVIQRVIDRMQPQIVELVTRQILRPLVESLVRIELEK